MVKSTDGYHNTNRFLLCKGNASHRSLRCAEWDHGARMRPQRFSTQAYAVNGANYLNLGIRVWLTAFAGCHQSQFFDYFAHDLSGLIENLQTLGNRKPEFAIAERGIFIAGDDERMLGRIEKLSQ